MTGPAPEAAPEIRWVFDAGAQLTSSPVVAKGQAIQGTTDGTLASIDLETGATRWMATLNGAIGTPLIVDDLVIAGTTSGEVAAVARSLGRVVWRTRLEGEIRGAPVAIGDGVIVASSRGEVVSLRPRDGDTVWQQRVDSRVLRSLAGTDDTVVIPAEPGAVVALTAEAGSIRWQSTMAESGGIGSPSIDDEHVFVATGLDDGLPDDRAVVAIDLATGAPSWRWPSVGGAHVGTPALYDGTAFVVSEAGFVVALDATTGQERWRTTLEAPVEALPAVAGNSLIIAENRRDLVSVATGDGSVLWRVPLKGVPYAPVVTCGVVLVPSNLGTLTAYAAPS